MKLYSSKKTLGSGVAVQFVFYVFLAIARHSAAVFLNLFFIFFRLEPRQKLRLVSCILSGKNKFNTPLSLAIGGDQTAFR